MGKTVLLLLAVSLTTPALAAPPGTAQNFLERANHLKARGPLAFFDRDYGRLKAEATAAGKSIGDDRIAAERAGKPVLYCSPSARARLGSYEFIDGLEAIPAPERARMSLKDAMLRTLQAADIAGIRAFIVHAKNEQVRDWYQRFDLTPSPTDPLHLYVLIKDLQRNLQ